MSQTDRLRELRIEFCQERDPIKQQELFDRLFTLIEARWKQLVADEHDPAQLRAMIVELDAILQERSTEPKTWHDAAAALPKSKAKSCGEEG